MNTVTFKIKTTQETTTITEIALPAPSYYRSEKTGNYVALRPNGDTTRVRFGGYVPGIEVDDFLGFNPATHVPVSEEEFRTAYDKCEAEMRSKTFAFLEHSHDEQQNRDLISSPGTL